MPLPSLPSVLRRITVASAAVCVVVGTLPASAGERSVPEPTEAPAPTARAAALAAPAGAYVEGQVLVGFAEGTAKAERVRVLARRVAGARIAGAASLPGMTVVKLGPGEDVIGALRAFERDPAVAWAEPNWLRQPLFTPNDPMYGEQWGLVKARVDDAWDVTTGDPGTVIAVVDSGIQHDHSDLQGNLWANPTEVDDGDDDDGNGLIDDVYGWDFFQDDETPQDLEDHGTHVAGIAAAIGNNAEGISGVCPDCSIMALRASGPQGFPVSAIVASIRYAAREGAHVVNMSFGGPQWSRAERKAIVFAANQGVVPVAAAGNESANNDSLTITSTLVGPSYPASYDVAELISVAASNSSDRLAGFSNLGKTSVDVAAPGVNIRSTVPGDAYASFGGTSMASPFVAGLAALVVAERPPWSPLRVKNAILNSAATPNSLGRHRTVTDGRVDAEEAVTTGDTSNATPKHDGVMSNAIGIRFRRSGSLSLPKDVNDIYRMRLRKGRTYAALLEVPARRDFDLFVWKPGAQDTWPIDLCNANGLSCFLQGFGVNGKGRDEYVRFRAKKTGVHYFHVNAFRGTGTYRLTVGVP